MSKGVYVMYESNFAYFYADFAYEKYELGRYEEAIKDFDQAIALNPNKVDYFYWCGLSKYQLSRYEEANQWI